METEINELKNNEFYKNMHCEICQKEINELKYFCWDCLHDFMLQMENLWPSQTTDVILYLADIKKEKKD